MMDILSLAPEILLQAPSSNPYEPYSKKKQNTQLQVMTTPLKKKR
jgi:hypothetical protein